MFELSFKVRWNQGGMAKLEFFNTFTRAYGYYPGMGFGFYFDPTYLLVLIGAVFSLLASALVNGTYAKYNKVRSMSNMSGAQVVERILRQAGINDVRVQHISGKLTDN